jgi:hypothetical protein
MSVTFDADLFGRRLKRLYDSWQVSEECAGLRTGGRRRRACLRIRKNGRTSLSSWVWISTRRRRPSDAHATPTCRSHSRSRTRYIHTLTPIPQDDADAAAGWGAPRATALALALGTSLEENRYRKTTAAHLWLFTYELPGKLVAGVVWVGWRERRGHVCRVRAASVLRPCTHQCIRLFRARTSRTMCPSLASPHRHHHGLHQVRHQHPDVYQEGCVRACVRARTRGIEPAGI